MRMETNAALSWACASSTVGCGGELDLYVPNNPMNYCLPVHLMGMYVRMLRHNIARLKTLNVCPIYSLKASE